MPHDDGDPHGVRPVEVAVRPGVAAELQAAEDNATLLREWLVDSISIYSYFTFFCSSEFDDTSSMRVFQLLSAPRAIITVHTFDTNDKAQRLQWNLLPLDVWRRDFVGDTLSKIEAFEVGDSTELDLTAMLEGDLEARNTFKSWTPAVSELDGCINLHTPVPLCPRSPVHAKTAPLLGLWDALDSAGHIAVNRLVTHTSRSGLVYDNTMLRNRAYMKCVLLSSWLFEQGQSSFPSRQSVAYYTLVLKAPGKVPSGQSARDYAHALKTCEQNDTLVVATLPPARSRKRKNADREVDGHDEDGPMPRRDASVDGNSVSGQSPSCDDSDSSSSSSSSSESNSSSGGVDGNSEDGEPFPASICGSAVRAEAHDDKRDAGLRITCPLHGAACRCFRALGRDNRTFGRMAPVYFLHAWALAANGLELVEHRRHKPNHAAIRKVIADHYA
jgi:hypothetical protein